VVSFRDLVAETLTPWMHTSHQEGLTMSGDDLLKNFFRTPDRAPIPEVLMEEAETLVATPDVSEDVAPNPLLAEHPVDHGQWRGYVLICVNADVVSVCDRVKERLGTQFRGMSLVTGLYDLIVRVEADSKEHFKEMLILVRETPGVIQSVTLLDLN